MAALDMSPLRRVLEDLILSASDVRVTRDNGVGDDVLDEESGELTPVTDLPIYAGPGAITALATGGQKGVEALDVAILPTERETSHRLLIPVDVDADIYIGDVVTATRVDPKVGDPELVGELFVVSELPNFASLSVARIVFLRPHRTPLVQPDEVP